MSDAGAVKHTASVPMRWSDLDALNHVNNASYMEYSAEAWRLLEAQSLAGSRREFKTVSARYTAPLRYAAEPVHVITEVTPSEVVQVIRDAAGTVAASLTFQRTDPVMPPRPARHRLHEHAVRLSDLDGERRLSDQAVWNLFQEARIRFNDALDRHKPARRFALAAVTVEQIDRPVIDHAVVTSATWVDHIGTSSFSLSTQLCVAERVVAASSSRIVAFDPMRQAKDTLYERERSRLAPFLA